MNIDEYIPQLKNGYVVSVSPFLPFKSRRKELNGAIINAVEIDHVLFVSQELYDEFKGNPLDFVSVKRD